MVRDVKDKNTDAPFEKSRLVVQGHSDAEKAEILTQSPTIQRSSQRLVLNLAPTFVPSFVRRNKNRNRTLKLKMSLSQRDITQAYPQSKTQLNRQIIARLPIELQEKYPRGTILRIEKPLYGVAEAGLHWLGTYQKNHLLSKLRMAQSCFDPCLMITTAAAASDTVSDDDDYFGITALQTDDTLFLASESFLEKEETELKAANLRAKPREEIGEGASADFNGCRISREKNGTLTIRQKGQAGNLAVIDASKEGMKQAFVEQRARGAYIASICQPEAAFDLAVAAQSTANPTADDVKKLNTRLQWQIDNRSRGIRYIPLQLESAKLMVFTDGSFANNKDLSSQIGFIVALVNEISEPDKRTFIISGNLVHWHSAKCKRVTRSVLASEIYGLAGGFDMGFVLHKALEQVTEQLGLPRIPLVVCTDSYSLYECLVKLGTTAEKRLMIDIMALRESYESREINEVRWIDGRDNPADAMTKASPNSALERFISTNQLTIRLEGWVDRRM